MTAVTRMPVQRIEWSKRSKMADKKIFTCFPSTVCSLSTFPNVPFEER